MGSPFKMKLATLILAALAAPSWAKNFGGLNVDGVGQVYVVGPDWSAGNVQMNGNSGFTLRGGGRIYLASKADDGFGDPNLYWQTPLNGKHFSYTLDLSPGNWYDCDRGGCQNNAFYVDSNMFCPEDRCTINTNRPFLVSHFQNDKQANIWMQQDGREASFDFCSDAGYAGRMAQSYDGMVFSASLWGGNGINMDWLDGMTGCWGECNIAGSSVTFSNFNLW